MMSQNNQTPHQPPPRAEDEINLLEYLLVLVKHKKMIIGSCVVTFILACIVTLLMTNIYTSTARVLPSNDKSSGMASMLGDMGGLASLAGISPGGSNAELYAGMLKSRTIADAIIDQFDLMEVYEQEYRVKTYTALQDHVNISVGKDDNIISISVEDEDPQRAAAIANTYVNELQQLNVKLNLNSAGRERVFLQERLTVVKDDLINAEQKLQAFQEQNKTIRIDDQATAIIEAIARLKGELASKEVELGVLLSMQTEQNPQVKKVRSSIAQLKDQLAKLERKPEGQNIPDDIFLATSAVPELGMKYARLLREFKIQETLFELLTKQYEMAKIQEAKNTSTLQVLDDAVPADKKSKPRRSLIVLVATFVVGFFAVIWAFMREYGQRMPDEDRKMWKEIKSELSLRRR
jgi:uncharacterized protein involved in exopolysaccharide biosynthesis